MIITIDGPAASGKSTLAKMLADHFDFYHFYTGMLYRAVGYVAATKLGIAQNDLEYMKPGVLTFIDDIFYEYKKGEPHILYQGVDITNQLTSSSCDQHASIVSKNRYVRDALLDFQRAFGARYNIVADGRDCGSVVFPDAEYKFFLTASLEVRARRKSLEGEMSYEQALKELKIRDERDSSRDIAPLTLPAGAIVVDNSGLNLEETLNVFLEHLATVS